MRKYIAKILAFLVVIGGSIFISANDAQARPELQISVVAQKSYHHELKATYPESCNQMILSYDVNFIKKGIPDKHHVRGAADNTRVVTAGWYDTSVYMKGFSKPLTVIRIKGNTLLL